ncbi:hypothetical protein L873DRAFT_1433411 [Choiromyces venosus 120613-1]|uniref:Uncharacterized protein n=1 Tax=Choiromyces venosus 120613-1 TaxID=1336337 RepID=A0A3N4JAR7_9PEZI|nr:hypothetical protein L873DRAFT_1433411 [Choiromyces venosus 120613-1]
MFGEKNFTRVRKVQAWAPLAHLRVAESIEQGWIMAQHRTKNVGYTRNDRLALMLSMAYRKYLTLPRHGIWVGPPNRVLSKRKPCNMRRNTSMLGWPPEHEYLRPNTSNEYWTKRYDMDEKKRIVGNGYSMGGSPAVHISPIPCTAWLRYLDTPV